MIDLSAYPSAEVLEKCLNIVEKNPSPSRERALAIATLAQSWLRRDPRQTMRLVEEGRANETPMPASDSAVWALLAGQAQYGQGQFEEAAESARQALESLRGSREIRTLAVAHNLLGNALNELGSLVGAVCEYQKCLELSRESGLPRMEATSLANLGLAFSYMGETARAVEYYEQGLDVLQTQDHPRLEGNLHLNLGFAHMQSHLFREAVPILQAAIAAYERDEDAGGIKAAYHNLVECHLELGDMNSASHSLAQAQSLGARAIIDGKPPFLEETEGLYHAGVGHIPKARQAYTRALARYREAASSRGEVLTLLTLARLEEPAAGERGAFLDQAIALARKARLRPELRDALEAEAAWREHRGQWPEAYRALSEARQLDRELREESAETRLRLQAVSRQLDEARARAETEQARGKKLGQALAEAEHLRTQADELSRQKSELLRIAAHDLRGLASAILSPAELLAADLEGEGETAQLASLIYAASDRLLATLDRLFEAATLESGGVDLHLGQLDLVTALQEEIETWKGLATRKGQTFEVHLPPEAQVMADRARLGQIVGNLLGNAIKYSPQGARIEAVLVEDDHHWRVEICDQGPGILAHEQERLFRPFSRLSARPTAGESSTGLGLYIVRMLTERHGGACGAEARSPGPGSVFWFRLPIATAAPSPPPSA